MHQGVHVNAQAVFIRRNMVPWLCIREIFLLSVASFINNRFCVIEKLLVIPQNWSFTKKLWATES